MKIVWTLFGFTAVGILFSWWMALKLLAGFVACLTAYVLLLSLCNHIHENRMRTDPMYKLRHILKRFSRYE